MRLTFHSGVAKDIIRIITHYQNLGGPNIAAEFNAEIRATFLKALEAPRSYQDRGRGVRRVNLPRFPYHFLFRIVEKDLRVLVVRHHGRRPSLGTSRR